MGKALIDAQGRNLCAKCEVKPGTVLVDARWLCGECAKPEIETAIEHGVKRP